MLTVKLLTPTPEKLLVVPLLSKKALPDTYPT